MHEEHVPASQVEVLEPIERTGVANVVREATMSAGLSEREQYAIEWKIRRARSQMIGRLVKAEANAAVGQALEIAQGRVAAERERTRVRLHAERMRCVAAAGEELEDALHAAATISDDDIRELTKSTMLAAGQRYMKGVVKRSAG